MTSDNVLCIHPFTVIMLVIIVIRIVATHTGYGLAELHFCFNLVDMKDFCIILLMYMWSHI